MNSREHQHGNRANVLIGETDADTIVNLRAKVGLLYLSVNGDDQLAHPGVALDLRAVLGALESLDRK